MHSKHRFPNMIFGSGLRLDGTALAIMFLLLFLLFVLLFMMFTAQPAQAGGAQPFGDLIIGSNGNLFGTASGGGSCPPYVCGVVFEISP